MDAAPAAYRDTFARLLGFLRPYKLSLAVSIVLAAASQAASIALIVITGAVIDNAIRIHDHGKLWLYIVLILVIGLAKAVFMVGRRFISGRQALGVEYDMRNALYAHLLRLSFGFYDRHQTGQLMSRATIDLQTVRFFLGYGLIFFFQHVITLVGVTAVMFWYDWRLALIGLAITPILVGLAYRYSHISHPVLRDVQQKMADVATVAEENIVGVHVVKSFAQEPSEQAKFESRSQAVFRESVKANRQRAFYVPLISFIPLLAQAGVLLYGGHQVINGQMPIGHFISFNLLLSMLVLPLRMLGMWIGQAQRATASGERIFQVMDEPEEVKDGDYAVELPPGEGVVRFENVSFAYVEGRPVLEEIELPIEAGRADRPHGVGEDHARVPRPTLLRRERGTRDDRRCGRTRASARVAAQPDRRHLPGSVPVFGVRAREHLVRGARRDRRGGRARGPARPGA